LTKALTKTSTGIMSVFGLGLCIT